VRTGVPIRDVTRKPDQVQLRDADDRLHTVDRVVVATHADQALALLTDASDDETATLSAFGYSRNQTVLHTDSRILPEARQARSSWNYLMRSCDQRVDTTVVSYWMNRLQGHTGDGDYIVSLNAGDRIDPATVLARMSYEHPIYTPDAVSAQPRLASLATAQTVFAGAYHGWGFHEDGCRSGVEAAAAFGAGW
jgi:predicted NAD/FAD-binding protein